MITDLILEREFFVLVVSVGVDGSWEGRRAKDRWEEEEDGEAEGRGRGEGSRSCFNESPVSYPNYVVYSVIEKSGCVLNEKNRMCFASCLAPVVPATRRAARPMERAGILLATLCFSANSQWWCYPTEAS